MLVVVDIDGTLADLSVRFKKAEKPPRDSGPEAMQMWLDKVQAHKDVLEDRPIQCMRELIGALSGHHEIIYLTGRSEDFRTVTMAWLKLHDFPFYESKKQLFMRENNDWRKPFEYKRDWVEKHTKRGESFLVIDDDYDGCCSDMYRGLGGTHLKVMGDR